MKKFIVLLPFLLATTFGHAATVSFQYGLPIVQSQGDANETGLLGLFDPTLGTLTSASLTWKSSAISTVTLVNSTSTPQLATATTSISVVWDSTLAPLDPFLVDQGLLITPFSGFQTIGPGQSSAFAPSTGSASITQDLSAILTFFSGVGTFPMHCVTRTTLLVNGNVSAAANTFIGCGAEITYTYTPKVETAVALPTTVPLLALGLTAILAVSRRRKFE
jgi:hypothetical protein